MPQVARRYMGFADGDGVTVHVDDGRRFLERHDERWDVIVADTYIGLSVPFHMTTREFLDLVDRRLATGGVLVVNLAAGLDEPFPRAIYRTLAERFETVDAFPVPGLGNTVLFARHGVAPRRRDARTPRRRARPRARLRAAARRLCSPSPAGPGRHPWRARPLRPLRPGRPPDPSRRRGPAAGG